MLFGDAAGDAAPWWVAGVMGAIGVGYALAKLYYHVKSQRREDSAASDQHTEAKESRRRREASEEAWQVVDRQNKVIEGFQAKFDALEAKCDAAVAKCEEERDECNRERAYLQGTLNVVVAWATSKGMKVPPQFQPPGSGTHTPHKEEGA